MPHRKYLFSPVLRKEMIVLLSVSLWKVRNLPQRRKDTNPKVRMMENHLLSMTLLQEESSIQVPTRLLEKKTETAPVKKKLT